MTPSEIQRVVDVNQIKLPHFGCVAIFSSNGLLIALVEFRPFTTMSEVEVNQWDELSQFLFCERKFTDPIQTNGNYWRDLCLQLGGANAAQRMNNLVFMEVLGKLKIQKMNGGTKGQILACYEANISANQGASKFASALTFTMNRFKNSPHLDEDASLYALRWWFQADTWTGLIQRDASKWCTGGKLIFPNENFCIDLLECHGLIQVVWASSTFVHYNDPAHNNESTTLVGISAQCSRRLAKTMWRKSHGYYEIGEGAGYHIRDGNTISSQIKE
ncbi:hypothetical protein O181_018024 [Austropuccinia psidii MF-1]|uniref:Tet-like 2OG-Fe(II) oxygenase domain-containing protein n=1 Tax=Austropuccinia psidii MF-1 TaxID=1389203 RepID=A0A9Q3C6V2_9BASI|nr:hypothetical protein [Austropuccinia psidii MF-1]